MCVYIYIFTFVYQWRLQEFCLGGSLKNFNKKELEYSELPTKNKLIYEVLQFPSTSIQILNYEYLLSMWVGMTYGPTIILFC